MPRLRTQLSTTRDYLGIRHWLVRGQAYYLPKHLLLRLHRLLSDRLPKEGSTHKSEMARRVNMNQLPPYVHRRQARTNLPSIRYEGRGWHLSLHASEAARHTSRDPANRQDLEYQYAPHLHGPSMLMRGGDDRCLVGNSRWQAGRRGFGWGPRY